MNHTYIYCLWITMLSSLISLGQTANPRHPHVLDIGLKAGGNFDKYTNGYWDNVYRGGLHGGAYATAHGRKLGLQIEAVVKSSTFRTVLLYNGYSYGRPEVIKTVTLNFPLLFMFRLARGTWIQLGPQWSMITSSSEEMPLKKWSYSFVAGIQHSFPRRFSLGGRYIYGLSDNEPIPNYGRLRSVEFYLGFRLH
jgi:hypothetical protein